MMNAWGLVAAGIYAASLATYGTVNRLTVAHIIIIAFVTGLVAIRRTRWIGMAMVPVMGFMLAYDLLRIFAERALAIVVIKPVYDLERAIFGIDLDGVETIPNEWITGILSTPLDLLGGVVYSTHIVPIASVGIWLLYKHRARNDDDERTIAGFFWGLFLLNIIAYTTMYLMPVAPPWYVEAHGFMRPEELVIGNPARLARVDEWLGGGYFTGVYAEGAYTFGAVPSLHCAYPVYAALFLKNPAARVVAWTWAVLMMFYAVYLNHHYIVDLIAGASLSLTMWLLVTRTPLGDWTRRLYGWQLNLYPHRDDALTEPHDR